MFKNIKYSSPTAQLFFLFGLIVFGFLVYMVLQSAIVLSAFPGIENEAQEDVMGIVMNSKNGIAQLLLILQQTLFFLFPGIAIALILKNKDKGIYNFDLKWKGFIGPVSLLFISLFSFYFLIYFNLQLVELLPNSDYLIAVDEESSNTVITAVSGGSTYLFILNLIGIALLPAIGEELIFRGFLVRNFYQNSNNIYFAIFGSAALFALIHFQPVKFIPMFLMGVMFAVFYVQTKNLLVPIVCHFINNLMSLLAIRYSFLESFENLMVSGLAAGYVIFRLVVYFRNLNRDKVYFDLPEEVKK